MFSCFNMIVIRTYISGLPNALVESARIDGAGDIRVFWQIIFPLCKPVLATVALFLAVGSRNSWFECQCLDRTGYRGCLAKRERRRVILLRFSFFVRRLTRLFSTIPPSEAN